MRPSPPGADESPPIFIFGVLERSGTNFLSDLICRHPACRPAHPLDEAFFHFRADLLERYVSATAAKWHPDWGLNGSGPDELLAALGRGLLSYVDETAARAIDDGRNDDPTAEAPRPRIVVKTPSVKNLRLFPRLFPGASAIVLMRDGRAVVESGVRSFGFTYEEQTRKWVWAARVIERNVGTNGRPEGSPFLLVRYEDLVTDTDSQVRRILAFTGLDAARYDFGSIDTLPVRGSSTYRGSGDAVNWTPVQPSATFKPLDRWRTWGPARHDRFNWLGGRELVTFGYELEGPDDGPIHELRNRFKDLAWRVRRVGRHRRAKGGKTRHAKG